MIAEQDRESRNPQTLARLSLQGEATILPAGSPEYAVAREATYTSSPMPHSTSSSATSCSSGSAPHSARLVTGFGRIFDLSGEDLADLGIPITELRQPAGRAPRTHDVGLTVPAAASRT